MAAFYVLTDPKAEDANTLGLAVTDFVQADPVNVGVALRCSVCNRFITGLPWLPPYRAELEFWGKEAGDSPSGLVMPFWYRTALLDCSGLLDSWA